MAVEINVASTGYLGPVGIGAVVQPANGVETTVQRNMALVIPKASDDVDTTVKLPAPPDGLADTWAGSIIIIKSLTDSMITISAEDVNIDGTSTNLELDTAEQVVSFYFINNTIGWMAGPATF